MTHVFLPDLRLNADLSGPATGPALVLVHALGTDLHLWDAVLPLLPSSLRILRFDLRGHGASDTPSAPYSMGALIRDTERLIEHFGLKDAVVLGVSLGGLIAQGLAVKRLDLVRALVLSNTAAKIGRPEHWADRIATVRSSGMEVLADPTMERWFGRNWRTNPVMPLARARFVTTQPDGWCGCAAAISGTDFYETTATLRLPTLVFAGSNDASTPPDLVRETADLIPGHRFQLLRGAGHLPMLEKPAEYAAVLSAFLDSIGHV